jgi:hypothetical protein
MFSVKDGDKPVQDGDEMDIAREVPYGLSNELGELLLKDLERSKSVWKASQKTSSSKKES